MFEHKSQRLLPRRNFLLRALRFAAFAGLIIGISLLIGMIGYRLLAGVDWISAFYNASMILTGMGPGLDINVLPAERQARVEIFAGLYALYSGVVFLAASGLILSPLLHRFFHKMHLEFED